MRSFAIAVLCVVAGCDLYYKKPPPPCYEAPPAQFQLRDPDTGQCQSFGGGGGDCGACGPCVENAAPGGGGAIADPDWAPCNGVCESLDEQTCLSTPGCHAAYLDPNASLGESGGRSFLGCWDIASSAPVAGGGCDGLDSQSCSERDDCSPIYQDLEQDSGSPPGIARGFTQCIPEKGDTCSNAGLMCAVGSHCEDECTKCNSAGCDQTCHPACVPDDPCAGTDCAPGETCVEQCTGATCAPTCVPATDPGSCSGTATCESPAPVCPTGTTPGIANGCYTGYCIPLADCGPADPGTCSGTVSCGVGPPMCPQGTLPGIANGCWTGFCIPDASCPQQPCDAITSETVCDARPDCEAVYTGTDCTCDASGQCTCDSEMFERCQAKT